MTQTMIEYTGKNLRDLQVSAAVGSGQAPVTSSKMAFIYIGGILLRNIPTVYK